MAVGQPAHGKPGPQKLCPWELQCNREYEEPAADGPLFHWGKYQALSTRGTKSAGSDLDKQSGTSRGGNLSAVVGGGVASRLG